MADIFISYARTDRDRIEKLAAALEDEGYSVWWDRHIESGAEFSKDIERELNDAKAVIVCWSAEGSNSRWVKDEANIAADAGKLLAVTLDADLPPIGFRQYHAVDFSAWKGGADKPAFQDLARALGSRLKADQPSSAPSMEALKTKGPAQKNPIFLVALAGMLAALVLAVVISFMVMRGGDNDTLTPRADTAFEQSVAVLPFDARSSGENDAYFADGLTEEIISSLARLSELKVISRASSFYFKDREEPPSEIADKLGVANLVVGSVQRDGPRLRISAQLIRAADGVNLWSDSYDRPAADLFAVQDDIAENIAVALDIFLDDQKRSLMITSGTRNIDAFEALLKGRRLYDRSHRTFSAEDRWNANQYFEEATRLDPGISAAYGLHHDAYAHFLMQDTPAPASVPNLTDAQALIQIRSDLAEATNSARDPRAKLSMKIAAAIFGDSWENVPELIEEELAFVDAGVAGRIEAGWVNMFLVALGFPELALRRADSEILYNPLDPVRYSDASGAALAMGDLENSLRFARRGLEIAPDHMFLRKHQAIATAMSGDIEGAAEKMDALRNDYVYNMMADAYLGDHERARSLAKERAQSNPRDASPIWVFAELGDEAEVTQLTRLVDASPAGALSFLRLIYQSGGHVPFDMDAAPNFRARLREAGIDPASFKKWVPLSKARARADEKSIAILPFADMSEAGDQEYFSDGMAEEILNALVKIPNLRVAGRTSSFSFKGKDVELPAIGAALNVSHILEGSVRKQGDHVRITAQLVKAEDGFHLWSQSYDGTLDNIFDLQDEISRAIARELQVLLNVGENTRLAENLTDNKLAYDLYLQGHALRMQLFGDNVLPRAAALFEEAVVLDPQFAEAWAELAVTYFLIPIYTTVSDQAALDAQAQKSADKALELDPDNVSGKLMRAVLKRRRREFVEAGDILNQVSAAHPESAEASYLNGYSRAAMGQTHAAIPYLERAVEIDPANGNYNFQLGLMLFNAGQLDAAEARLQLSHDLGFAAASSVLATIAYLRGDAARAMDLLLTGFDSYGQHYVAQFRDRAAWEMAARGFYSGQEEDRERLVAFVDAYLQLPSPIVDWPMLSVYLRTGETQKFMDVYDNNVFSNPEYAFLNIWDGQETSRKVRQHPNFNSFAQRNGLLSYWQKHGWPDLCRPLPGTDGSDGQFMCD